MWNADRSESEGEKFVDPVLSASKMCCFTGDYDDIVVKVIIPCRY